MVNVIPAKHQHVHSPRVNGIACNNWLYWHLKWSQSTKMWLADLRLFSYISVFPNPFWGTFSQSFLVGCKKTPAKTASSHTPLLFTLLSLSYALIPSLLPKAQTRREVGSGGQQQGLSASCRACGQEEPPLALSLQGWKVCVVGCAPTSHLPAWERKLGAARENKQTIR